MTAAKAESLTNGDTFTYLGERYRCEYVVAADTPTTCRVYCSDREGRRRSFVVSRDHVFTIDWPDGSA